MEEHNRRTGISHYIKKTARGLKGKNLFVFGGFILIIAVIIFEAMMLSGSAKAPIEKDFSAMAKAVVEKCSGTGYRPICYETEIPKLMAEISMEDAFSVTRDVQDLDPSYQYCHVLGHKLAEKETAKDPSLWKTVVQRCPSGLCSNGCIHGAFQQRFRKESLSASELVKFEPEFSDVCEERPGFSPTGLEQASCYHALGHLFMYVTAADVNKSLALCQKLAVKQNHDWSQLCFDGTFMQIFQPLEPDDFSLIAGKEVDLAHVKNFCDLYSGREKGSCWSESWPLFRQELSLDPKKLVAHCDYLGPGAERDRCFNALMYVLTAQMGFDDAKIVPYCAGMPAQFSANCFAQASSRLIETDYRNSSHAALLCEKAAPYDRDDLCFKELIKYSTYNFHPGSPAFESFCGALPSPWKETCFGRAPQNPTSKAVAE